MRRDAFGGRAGDWRELSRAGEKSARAGKGLAARFCGPHPASRAAISLAAAPSSFSPSPTPTPTRRAPGFLGSPPGTGYDGSSSRGGPSQLPAAAPSRGGALPAAVRSQRRRHDPPLPCVLASGDFFNPLHEIDCFVSSVAVSPSICLIS